MAWLKYTSEVVIMKIPKPKRALLALTGFNRNTTPQIAEI